MAPAERMAGSKDFDPLAYIESAFLDKPKREKKPSARRKSSTTKADSNGAVKFRKTRLDAPRPRRAGDVVDESPLDPELQEVLQLLPKNLDYLARFYSDDVTAHYYQGEFKEDRQELIRRLIDPVLTLEEVSRLLGVVPATVRRYTNRGWLECFRTKGGQRRFRLSQVVRFIEQHGRLPEE